MNAAALLKAGKRVSPTRSVLVRTSRRSFFSFLKPAKESVDNDQHNNNLLLLQEEQQLQEQILVDRTLHRYSLVHAHPQGPWQAMLNAVIAHHDASGSAPAVLNVLDLACGPRGEPGTTIARALPLATVLCTDSCPKAVAAILLASVEEEKDDTNGSAVGSSSSPPTNLTKAVADLTDLAAYDSNSFDIVTCCYGYGLSSDVPRALAEAHRVLVPGGALITATWDSSSMLQMGRDVLASARGYGRDVYAIEDDEAFLPPRLSTVEPIELSGPGEWEGLLVNAGFTEPDAIVSSIVEYPFTLGRTTDDQFALGTILIRKELEGLGALHPYGNGKNGSTAASSGWNSLAEESFWTTIHRYSDIVDVDMLLLRDNRFKLAVATKKR